MVHARMLHLSRLGRLVTALPVLAGCSLSAPFDPSRLLDASVVPGPDAAVDDDAGTDLDCTPGVEEPCAGCGTRTCSRTGRWGDCLGGACEPCHRCNAVALETDAARCEVETVESGADGTCPAGFSRGVPDCAPCHGCEVTNGYCPDEPCCGSFTETGAVMAGCSCFGCEGTGRDADASVARSLAEEDSHVECAWPADAAPTFCGYAPATCTIVSCGAACP